MATKVNRDYWSGTIYNMTGFPNADDVGYLDGGLYELINNNKWDIANNNEFDLSVCPWGLPQCSLASLATPVFAKDEGNKVILSFQESTRRNMPIFFNRVSGRVNTDPYSATVSRNDNKQRIVGDTAKATDSSYMRYTTNVDTQNISPDSIGSNTKPIVSLKYDSVRCWLGGINYIDTLKYDNFSNFGLRFGSPYDFLNLKNTDLTKWRYKLVRTDFGLSSNSDKNVRIHCRCAGKSNIPEYLQTQYYNDGTTEYIDLSREIRIIGQNVGQYPGYGNYGYTYLTGNSRFSNTVPTLKTTKSSDYACSADSTCICNASAKRQKFDDVSYHWEQHLFYFTTGTSGSGVRLELKNGEVLPFNDSQYLNPILTLEIDDTIYDNYYDSAIAALKHEMAFLGFPFVLYHGDVGNEFGDDDCYLPVFDYEHMITTGEYKSGEDSLLLPNATWGDIFDTSVPAYDPSYNPPEPTPSDDDYGYLNNKATTNRVYSSNNRVYALTESQYNQFIKDINSLYLNDVDGFEKFQLDFKGTNPTDYIVGSYGYTFLPAGLIPNQTAENIQIGAVTLPNAQGYRIAPAYVYNYKSLGEIDLTGAGLYTPFGDFRDYEPYTNIELYVPLCGNIKLDPSTVVGHTLQIEMRFDIMTGNATACVYRDNSTLIATIAGQLAANLPLSAGRMGDYQNAIKQAENALKQNELKTMTAAATVAIGVGAALLAPETGGLSLAAYGAAVAGASSLMSLSNQKNEIEYEITHKQPSISVCSAANGAVAQNISSMYAVCYVKQCKMLSSYNAETYAHTIGHACVINSTIADQVTDSKNSFIKCGNVDLSGISATASEISAIQSLLTSGIYI